MLTTKEVKQQKQKRAYDAQNKYWYHWYLVKTILYLIPKFLYQTSVLWNVDI